MRRIYVLYSMSLVIDGTIKNRFKKIPLYANEEIVKFHIKNRYREFNRYITWTTGHFWNRFFEVHYFVDLSLPGIALSSNLAVLQCHPSTNLNNRTFEICLVIVASQYYSTPKIPDTIEAISSPEFIVYSVWWGQKKLTINLNS